jgi:hypothetical protein
LRPPPTGDPSENVLSSQLGVFVVAPVSRTPSGAVFYFRSALQLSLSDSPPTVSIPRRFFFPIANRL